jgi:transposase
VICQLYGQAQELAQQGVHLVSTDEKTGIQALERLYGANKPMQKGSVEKQEFEYHRHGTLCLLANWLVAEGKMLTPTISSTRMESDYAAHLEQTIASDPGAGWIFIQDQLNTHYSETLVRLVAKHCQIQEHLGEKAKAGILHNKQTRKQFLEDPTHRIRFVFTPKHCSWINQVELWFSILQRKLLKRASFGSLEELKEKLLAFIGFFNQHLAKPFQWQYKGKVLKI